MTEPHEAPPAPAPAVEAQEGASQGGPAHRATPPSTSHGAEGASAPQAAPADAASGTPNSEGAATSAAEQHVSAAGGASGNAPQLEDGSSADEDGEEGEEHEGEAAAQEAGGADAQRKKRRRRRRKKGGPQAAGEGKAAPAAEGAPEGAAAERHERPGREGAGGVFARFFEGAHAGKRHAFSVGEVVAGRVVRINDGAFVVDLFGKATAFVDIFEPHEVPHIPEPVPSAAAEPASAGGEAGGATEATGADAAGLEGNTHADAGASDASAAELSTSAEATAPGAPSSDAELAAEAGVQAPVQAEVGEAGHEEPSALAAPSLAAPTTEQVAQGAAPAELPSGEHHEAVALNGAAEPTDIEAAGVSSDAEHADESAHEERAAEPEPAPPPPPELGSIFRGRIGAVAESGHVVLVNRIIDAAAAKQRIVQAREQRQRVRGVVYGFNRGGFDVLVEGVRVFCPASGMALGAIDNPEPLLGQRLEFTVPPAKAGTHGLVVSRRGILERQQRKAAKQLFRSLQPGQRLRGRVTQVRDFGLFVDLGGIEGLVHQSELSFGRGVRPQDAAAVGDELEVQVLRVGEGQTRKERERVSLSIKALQTDPWSAHGELLEPGNIVLGKVVRTTEFGAFIELAPQIEGLLHISELGRELKHASQALQEGETLRVVVERVDRKARRISLSKLTQAEERSLEAGADVKSARPPKPGQHLTVVVDKVEHAGLVVQVPGVFGRRGRGFIPNSEMGTERGTDHRRGFPPGTEIAAKVIGVDRDGGFRLSRKALLVEEEKRAVQDYRREAARHGLGTFGDLLRAKLEGTKQSS